MKPQEGLEDEFVELDVNGVVENHGIVLDGVFNERTQGWDCMNSLVGNCCHELVDIVTLHCRVPKKETRQKPSLPVTSFSETMRNR